MFTGEGSTKKKMKMEEDDREKLERSSSNVDAILEDVIKGFEDKGNKNNTFTFGYGNLFYLFLMQIEIA
jgi:hypothetical protein